MNDYRNRYQEYVKQNNDDGLGSLSYELWLEQALMESEAKAKATSDLLEIATLQANKIREELKKNEEFQRWSRGYGQLSDQVRECFGWYQRKHEQVIGGAKAFNEDLIVYLRAIALVAAMVGNASTHREKAARLRGLIEQIESAVSKLREQSFRFDQDYYWSAPDVWRSDYPVREYLRRNQELEREIAELKGEKRPDYTPEDPDLPF